MSKIRPHQIHILCHNLQIRGQLPALIVTGGKDSCWKWSDFQLWSAREPDLGWGHTAYRRASLIDLYLQAKFQCNRRNFLWADGRTYACTYVQMDGRIFETDFI